MLEAGGLTHVKKSQGFDLVIAAIILFLLNTHRQQMPLAQHEPIESKEDDLDEDMQKLLPWQKGLKGILKARISKWKKPRLTPP